MNQDITKHFGDLHQRITTLIEQFKTSFKSLGVVERIQFLMEINVVCQRLVQMIEELEELKDSDAYAKAVQSIHTELPFLATIPQETGKGATNETPGSKRRRVETNDESQPNKRRREILEENPKKTDEESRTSKTSAPEVTLEDLEQLPNVRDRVVQLGKVSFWCFCGSFFSNMTSRLAHFDNCSTINTLFTKRKLCLCCNNSKPFCDPLLSCEQVWEACQYFTDIINFFIVGEKDLLNQARGLTFPSETKWPDKIDRVGTFLFPDLPSSDEEDFDIFLEKYRTTHKVVVTNDPFKCIACSEKLPNGKIKTYHDHAIKCKHFQKLMVLLFRFIYENRASHKRYKFPNNYVRVIRAMGTQ